VGKPQSMIDNPVHDRQELKLSLILWMRYNLCNNSNFLQRDCCKGILGDKESIKTLEGMIP